MGLGTESNRPMEGALHSCVTRGSRVADPISCVPQHWISAVRAETILKSVVDSANHPVAHLALPAVAYQQPQISRQTLATVCAYLARNDTVRSR